MSRQWRRRHHCIARADRDTAADVIASQGLVEALHASSSGVTVQTRRLRVVALRCASRCRDAAGMPKRTRCNAHGATTQRYEALRPVAPSAMPIVVSCSTRSLWAPGPLSGKAARCQSGGGYDGAKSWRVDGNWLAFAFVVVELMRGGCFGAQGAAISSIEARAGRCSRRRTN